MLVFCLVLFACFCCWAVVLAFRPCFHPKLDFGLRNGPRSLRLPNVGCCCTMHNSFKGTNTVLRPGESREGEGWKKKGFLHSPSICPCNRKPEKQQQTKTPTKPSKIVLGQNSTCTASNMLLMWFDDMFKYLQDEFALVAHLAYVSPRTKNDSTCPCG